MNLVALVGRLVKDPELRFVPGSGKAVTNFTVAVDKNLAKDKKQELEQKGMPTADFIRVVVWGKQAESCANYLVKGRLVAVVGNISTGSYKTNTGETRYTTDVNAHHVEFLEWGDKDKKTDNVPMSGGGSDDFGYAATSIEDDDDIPF
jgi:single-strand DNA-binding protein